MSMEIFMLPKKQIQFYVVKITEIINYFINNKLFSFNFNINSVVNKVRLPFIAIFLLSLCVPKGLQHFVIFLSKYFP